MKLKKILLWTAGIAGAMVVIDNMRIKYWLTIPVWATDLTIPVVKGRYDVSFDASKINITGNPGEYQIEFPRLDIIDKKPTPHVFLSKQFAPWKLPKEIVSQLSLLRIYWALSRIKITTTEDNFFVYVHINIPRDIKVPIYW